jgi:hypothetical protein
MDNTAGKRKAHWRGHVDAWRASGSTQKAYCQQHGLKEHSLSYWQRRLAEGFGYSHPAHRSTRRSRGAATRCFPGQRKGPTSPAAGRSTPKTARSAMAADGAGHGTPDGHALFPALWGSDSFNCGAGMGRISSATAFVKANMPLGLPGTLTDQQGCGTWGYMNRPGAAARPALHRQRAGNTMHHHPTDLLQLDQQFLLTA